MGETLRQARLDKGVTLAEAERDTRIRRRYLEALEAEDLASLPAPVYARGFIRTYADYLGLNPHALVDMFQPAQRREQTPTLRPAVTQVVLPRDVPLRPILYMAGAVLFLLLLVYLWTQYQAAAAAVREQEGLRTVRTGSPTPAPAARLSTPLPIAAASPTPQPTATPAVNPSPTPVVDGILVEFRTTSRVYVEAAVDGRAALAETLPAGTQRSLPLAKETVVMRARPGSGVEITVNGKRQEPVTSVAPVEFTWRR